MKKRDEIKINALSQLDDEIIERNTEKRARLIARPRVKRSIIYSVTAAVACFAIMLSAFIILLGGGVTPPIVTPGQIPVYQGMTVSDSFNGIKTAQRAHRKQLHPKPPHKDDVKEDEGVKNSLSVAGGMEEIYYATVGQDVYVTVHINNPDQYEILSFTLNGKTYSSYMFEEGSDMESLVLKVNVGEVTGIKEYTIDAIKYVDGTEIKDVRMEGDRTVAISVGNGTVPAASVSVTASYYTLSFNVGVTDVSGLIGYYGNNVYIILSDENGDIVCSAQITDASTPVVLDGLDQNTEYCYSVVAIYKSSTDTAPDVHTIAEGSAKTTGGLSSLGASISQNGQTQSVTLTVQSNEGAEIQSANILLGDTVVMEINPADLLGEGDTEIPLSELLYSHTYTFTVSYVLGGELYTDSVSFTTPTLLAPTVNVSGITTTEGDVTFRVKGTNASLTATSITVDIILNGVVVDTRVITDLGTEISKAVFFDGLDDGTEYTIKARIEYDLLDGEGTKIVTATVTAKTKATVNVTNMVMRSASTLLVGEKLLLQITLANENNAAIDAVILGGVKHNVATTSTTKILNLEIDTQLLGAGTHTLTLDALVSGNRTVEVNAEFSVAFTVKSKMSFAGVDVVYKNGTSYEPKSVFDYGDTLYLRLTLNDGEGCTVTSITVYEYDSDKTNVYDGVIKLDANYFLLPLSDVLNYTDNTIVQILVEAFTYVLDGKTESHEVNKYVSTSILPEISAETKYVYTIDDFKNMDDGYHYVLANDIDLAGANWTPTVFKGSFDGNGYAVKNFTCIGGRESSTGFIHTTGYSSMSSYAGLFYSADGVISNLRLEGVYVNIDYAYDESLTFDSVQFILFGRGTHALYNCSIDDTSSISITPTFYTSTDYHGTILELFSGQMIYGCSSDASVSVINPLTNTTIRMFYSDDVRDCKMGGSLHFEGVGQTYYSSSVYLPAIEACSNTSTVNVRDGLVYLGDEMILGDTYQHLSGKIVFIEGGYYIEDGNTKTEYITDDGKNIVREYYYNILKTETVDGTLTYQAVVLTDWEWIGLNCPDGTYGVKAAQVDAGYRYATNQIYNAVVLYIPSEHNGITISVIESVRYINPVPDNCLTDDAVVMLVIGNGIKKLGSFEYSGVDFMCGGINAMYIPQSVEIVGEKALYNRAWLTTVYCEANQRPIGWATDWIADDVTVIWGSNLGMGEGETPDDTPPTPSTPPTPDVNEGTVFVTNLVVYEGNVGYNEDGVTLMSRMGLDLAELEIPEGTQTVVIYLPDNYNGIPITHIEFVRITYNGEVYNNIEFIPSEISKIKVKVIIPNGVKELGMKRNIIFQPFAHGIIHELVIPSTVETVYNASFNSDSRLLKTIYCEAEAKPAGWPDAWNGTNATVQWGYKDE